MAERSSHRRVFRNPTDETPLTKLVLIGIGMDEAALRQRLDACLLTDAEMAQGPHAWTRYDDPFPAWS